MYDDDSEETNVLAKYITQKGFEKEDIFKNIQTLEEMIQTKIKFTAPSIKK